MARGILRGTTRRKWGVAAIWRTGESWFDVAGNRFNPQDGRACGEPGDKKGAPGLRDELAAPQKQMGPGVMAHMTVSSARGGTVLPPHMAPPKTTLGAAYCCDRILAPDVLPEIRAEMMGGGPAPQWAFMRDLAPPRVAKSTDKVIRAEKVKMLPLAPKGAGVNPLGVSAWDPYRAP